MGVLPVLHIIKQRRTPTHVTLRCACGWTHQETRRQNALARAKKIQGAVTRHFKEIETQPDQTHPFTGTGDVCAYDWPHGDVPSEPCGLPRGRHHQ